MSKYPSSSSRPHPQRGAAAIEFALVASLFFTLLLGVIEVARVLWMWNAATEATRFGARTAALCDINSSAIKTNVKSMAGFLTDANIVVTYLPSGCSAATCTSVSVSLTGYQFSAVLPLATFTSTLPSFKTTLPREYMSSTSNPACQ